MKMCHSLIGHLPPNHDVGREMASLHTQNTPQGTFQHLVLLAVILLLDDENFLICEEDVFMPVL
jgi:hypothetical protein